MQLIQMLESFWSIHENSFSLLYRANTVPGLANKMHFHSLVNTFLNENIVH